MIPDKEASSYLYKPVRSEADVRARRAILEASLRQEGAPESMIARLATDDTAVKMLDYEHKTMAFIANLFGAR